MSSRSWLWEIVESAMPVTDLSKKTLTQKQRLYMKMKHARAWLDEREELGEWHHMHARLKIPEELGYLKGETLVDVGCGNGRYLLYFKRSNKIRFCVGLDLSKHSIYLVNRLLKAKGFQVPLIIGDAENMPFVNNFFDIVFSTDVIEHLPHPPKGIQEIVRISKDKIIICTPNKLCPLDMSRFASIFGSHIPPSIEKYVTRFQLMKMLQNSGLEQENIIMLETSFMPLGWILVNRKLSVPMRLVNFLMFIENFLEKTPLVKHIAGVLVACYKS